MCFYAIIEIIKEDKIMIIKESLARLPLDQIQKNLCIHLTDDDSLIYIDGYTGIVGDDVIDPVDATIHILSTDLEHVLSGEDSAVSLFTSGRIEIDGDLSIAFRLKEIIG